MDLKLILQRDSINRHAQIRKRLDVLDKVLREGAGVVRLAAVEVAVLEVVVDLFSNLSMLGI